jgi:hypothetical protein
MGDTEERRSLSERFRRTKWRMESSSADLAAADTSAELSMAVHSLNLLAHEKFYPKADAQ